MEERILVAYAIEVGICDTLGLLQGGQSEDTRSRGGRTSNRRTTVFELVAKDLADVGKVRSEALTITGCIWGVGVRGRRQRGTIRAVGQEGWNLIPPVRIALAIDRCPSCYLVDGYARSPAQDILEPFNSFLQVLELIAGHRGVGNLGTRGRDGAATVGAGAGGAIGITKVTFLLALATKVTGGADPFAAAEDG